MTRRSFVMGGLAFVVVAGLVAYVVLWWSLARYLNSQIDIVWSQAAARHFIITGDKPVVYGFPDVPRITFKGTITDELQTLWTIPELTFEGYPYPGCALHFDLPQGLTISGAQLPQPLTANRALLHIRLPFKFPRSLDEADIRDWQAAGRILPVEALFVRTGPVTVEGTGTLSLDAQLQIAANIDARVVGLDSMVMDLKNKGILKEKNAEMAQSFLKALNKQDPVTGLSYFITPIRIQNRGIYLGPLRVASLPALLWNNGSLPVRRQLPDGG